MSRRGGRARGRATRLARGRFLFAAALADRDRRYPYAGEEALRRVGWQGGVRSRRGKVSVRFFELHL